MSLGVQRFRARAYIHLYSILEPYTFFKGAPLITSQDQFKRLINKRLQENWKSFNILFDMNHYGNCISIMCQELDQYIRLLFLLKQPQHIRDQLIDNSINDKKWYVVDNDNKKTYIVDKDIEDFAKGLNGWELDIFEFRNIFYKITNNFNYILKDPIKGLNDTERDLIYKYIKEYHDPDFNTDYTIKELVPVLPMIFKKISDNIKGYFV